MQARTDREDYTREALESRAVWHLQLDPEQLHADQRHSPAYMPMLEADRYDDDDYDDFDEDRTCAYCSGTGGDPWNDYILECPMCLGEVERL